MRQNLRRASQSGLVLQVLLALIGVASFLIMTGRSLIKNAPEYNRALRVAGDPNAKPEEINDAANGLRRFFRDSVNAGGTGVGVAGGGLGVTVGMDVQEAMDNVRQQRYVIRITPSPADPGPGQNVTVLVSVLNSKTGTAVKASVSGTDGYKANHTLSTNAQGQASFVIPGGAQGVTDHVTITVEAVTESYTYTF